MSFNTGLSGLNAASKNLDVIGHNIANANTVGMKSSRAEFAEAYASSLAAAGSGGFGIGVRVAAVSQQFTQGNITVTGNDLDVAINGAGFFVVDMPNGSRAYTRAGNFKLNNEGNIVTNDGSKLINPSSNMPITLPTGKGVTGKVTDKITAELNLDTRAPVYDMATNTPALSTYGTTVQSYDSQGAPINVDMYFRKVGANTWDVYTKNSTTQYSYYTDPATSQKVAVLPQTVPATPPATGTTTVYLDNTGAPVTLPTTGTPPAPVAVTQSVPATDPPLVALSKVGQVHFDANGNLDQTAVPDPTTGVMGALTSPPTALPINNVEVLGGATGAFNISLDLSSVTQNAQAFTVTKLEQTGRAPGQLTGIQIGADGQISARYSNGQTETSGQIQLANFRNVSGLAPINGGYWVQTSDSGLPVVSDPGTGNFGSLRSGALEESNVDLTAELVNMMTAQRTYQANAQTIKTQDQILSTLVNLR